MSHDHLSAAKRKKDDEFFTSRVSVDAEIVHYTSCFEGKVVYCNCDDADSAFRSYFVENYRALGLEGLFCTGTGECFEYNGNTARLNKINSDFRSSDSIKLLVEQAGIVVSNPPFSLFREYMEQLLEECY